MTLPGASRPLTFAELEAARSGSINLFNSLGNMVPGGGSAPVRMAGSVRGRGGLPSLPQQPIGERFVRRSQVHETPFNPGAPEMAMFAETKDPRGSLDHLRGYGPASWISNGRGATPIAELQPAILRAMREGGFHKEYGVSAAALARDANPKNIINGAGLWDNPRLVEEVWNKVLEPRGVTAIRTSDGLLIFDPKHARKIGGAANRLAPGDPQ